MSMSRVQISALSARGPARVVLLILATILAVAGGATAATAQVPGANGLIAFVRNGQSVFLMKSDGSNQHQLVSSRGVREVAWRPDGNAVLFTAYGPGGTDTDLFLVTVDGSSVSRITNGNLGAQHPSWSPDGSRIAYFNGSTGTLETIKADGSDRQVLSSCAGTAYRPDGTLSCRSGDFSPDGTQLVTDRDGVLYLSKADGSNSAALPTSNPAGSPRFSPDGTQVVFYEAPAASGGNTRIYVMKLDGTGETLLDTGIDPSDTDVSPEWQPVNSGTSSAGTTAPAPGSGSSTLVAGGTVSTGSIATETAPVIANIYAPASVSGTVSLQMQNKTTPAPSGFNLFGSELVIEAPPVTPEQPYQAYFTIDSSLLGGTAASAVQVFRYGTVVPDCTNTSTATPDPCVADRGLASDGSGDVYVGVNTSHFSTWNFGSKTAGPTYTLTGPFQPVDPLPTENTAKAGSAIPVKFKLGGDKGLDVFADGYPKSGAATCGSIEDPIEQTAASSTAPLSYDPTTGQYTWVWKTTTALKGCRELVLKFRDGNQLKAAFKLR